jgi:hypothetical protein
MTRWLQAANRSAKIARASQDENAKIEFLAEFMWHAYCARVSGPILADAELWDDVDKQTADIYLGHARAALGAINILAQATDA